MPVFILDDDIDRHGAGCDCGVCASSTGKYRGVSVRSILDPEEPLGRYFGPTEDAAWHNAVAACEENGWKAVDFEMDTKEVIGTVEVALEEISEKLKKSFLLFCLINLSGKTSEIACSKSQST